ncbi:MAG TPA: prolyl oligopeptidase family serine peptidase [Herpetosiphonaceae bacterium]
MTPTEYLEAILSLPDLKLPVVSDDRTWVSWTWFRAGPAADVYVAPTDGSAEPLRLSDTPDNTWVVAWTRDSRAVIVRQDKDGNERVQLFRIDLDRPLEMQPLTEADPGYYIRGGELHPNGRWLVYAANVDDATGQEIEPSWVYRHDLETGERLPLARPERAGMVFPALSPDGAHILYSRMDLHPAGEQVWLVDIEGRHDREILNFGADVKVNAAWFPDSRRVLVRAETTTHQRLGVWSLDGGEVRWLLDDPTRNIEGAFVPRGSDRIVVIEWSLARLRCSLLDPETGVETALPGVPGNLLPLAPLDDNTWIAQYDSSRHPADVVRLSLTDPRPESFTSLSRVWERTQLTGEDFTPAEDISWRSVDGLEVHGWLFRAQHPAAGTIVYVHGGPTAHTRDKIYPDVQFFARHGFNVFAPNYRGSTGFGIAFREAIRECGWGGLEQDDICTGIEALIAARIAAPGRVGITGTSYGGYTSWHAITHFDPDIIAASAPICGMTDLVIDYETTRPDLRPYSEEMMGGSPAEVPERYRERSPIHYVNQIKGQLLIIQGLQDPNVTPDNVHTVIEALEQSQIPYELLTFDDEGHGITKPKNERTLYVRLAEFFERTLKQQPESVSE